MSEPQNRTVRESWRSLALVAVAALAIAATGLVMLWVATGRVSETMLRWWALLGTLLLPIALVVGLWWGSHRVKETEAEARGRLFGIEAGVAQVMSAARQTADLRVHTVREIRRVEQPQPPYAVLPPADAVIVSRAQLPAGRDVYLE